MRQEEHLQTRRYGKSAAQLSGALAVAGGLTYVFFGLTSHNLSPDQYGEIVILWTVVFLVAATLFRPIEYLLARTLAERHGAGERDEDAFRAAAIIQLGLCVLAALAVLAARKPIQDNLFSEEPSLYWAMIAALVGYAFAYFARGLLAGRGEFILYAALLLIEVIVRLAPVVLVAIGVMSGTLSIAMGIALAPVAGLLVVPVALRRRRARRETQSQDHAARKLTLGGGGAFTVAVLVMMLTEQLLLSSGTLFVRASEGAAAAGYIFNVLMVARAPLVLFQAVAASLLPHLARLRARGDEASARAFRRSLSTTVMGVAVFAGATMIGVLAVGPAVMQVAFGDQFSYDRIGLAIVAAGMGLYLTSVSLNQAVLAEGRAMRAAIPWLGASMAFLMLNVWQPLSPDRTVELGFAISSGLLAVSLFLVYATTLPAPDEPVLPGSSEELEAQLATLDEGG